MSNVVSKCRKSLRLKELDSVLAEWMMTTSPENDSEEHSLDAQSFLDRALHRDENL